MKRSCMRPEITITGLTLYLLAACFMFVPATAVAAEVTVSAAITPSSFSIDESGRLSLTVHGTKNAELNLPEVNGLEILHQGQSSRINIVNGTYSSSVTTTYAVIATAPGRYTIPPIRVNTGKKSLETEPLELTVTKASATAAAGPGTNRQDADNGMPRVFMTLENLDGDHYLGEVVPVVIKAYFQQGLRADLASLPRLVGDSCVIAPLNKDPLQIRESVNGSPYNVLVWKTTLSPIKEGSHTLQMELDAVQYIQQRRQSTSMFDRQSPFGRDLFDDFFGGIQKRPFKLNTEPVQFTIHPLPEEGRPENFGGAVGRFTFGTTLEPNSGEVGEPLTLRMEIRGTGNLDRVEAPHFPETPDWKSYAPSPLETDHSAQQFGEKVFEQAVVAKNSRVKEVPSISFSYFDPEKKSYMTQTAPPLPVSISGQEVALPTRPTAAAPPQMTEEKQNTIDGLAPLHLDPGRQVTTIQPLFADKRFRLLLAFLLVLSAASAAVHFHQYRSQNRLKEKHHMRERNLQRSLQVMEAAAASEDSSAFLKEARNCIQQYFGSLWSCEPSAITFADIRTRGNASEQLDELFRMSEQAAYGGGGLDRGTMSRTLQVLRSELEGKA